VLRAQTGDLFGRADRRAAAAIRRMALPCFASSASILLASYRWNTEKLTGRPYTFTAKRYTFTYTREFEHASVFVDIERRNARIDWR
jgi:hypothetical protein